MVAPVDIRIIRVLVADDHEAVRSGLRFIIDSMAGWEVCGEAADGREAVELAIALKPAIVVMDMSMPGLNGLDATRQIRKLCPDAEILAFTGVDEEKLIHQMFEAGARGYILKTDPNEVIQAALRSLAEHKSYFTAKVGEVLFAKFLHGKESVSSGAEPDRLTRREREIVQLLAEGQSNKEVAATLGISMKTAETHRATVMKKLSLDSLASLVRYAIRNHIISP
jgi:DNA-binding NarL/FixJ family response regulator